MIFVWGYREEKNKNKKLAVIGMIKTTILVIVKLKFIFLSFTARMNKTIKIIAISYSFLEEKNVS